MVIKTAMIKSVTPLKMIIITSFRVQKPPTKRRENSASFRAEKYNRFAGKESPAGCNTWGQESKIVY